MTQLAEGETKTTELPCPPEGKVQMVEHKEFGMHSIAIRKMDIQASKVWVRDYSSWEGAFEAAMDKAGV